MDKLKKRQGTFTYFLRADPNDQSVSICFEAPLLAITIPREEVVVMIEALQQQLAELDKP